MKTVVIHRDFQDDKQTLGTFYVVGEDRTVIFKSECIERGWQDNERNISCYPEGAYPLELEYSNKFGMDLWELKEIPNRSECKIHSANYARQLNGCTALGETRADIDGDGYYDVTNSKKTVDAFHKVMGTDTKAIIIINNI